MQAHDVHYTDVYYEMSTIKMKMSTIQGLISCRGIAWHRVQLQQALDALLCHLQRGYPEAGH